jgi:hypothetical protein
MFPVLCYLCAVNDAPGMPLFSFLYDAVCDNSPYIEIYRTSTAKTGFKSSLICRFLKRLKWVTLPVGGKGMVIYELMIDCVSCTSHCHAHSHFYRDGQLC